MKKNPIKTLHIITIVLVVALIAVVAFKKDKVYIEDEEGKTYTGASSKFLKVESEDAPGA